MAPTQAKKATATTAPARKRSVPAMTAEHKAALAKGREEGRTVRTYLEALEARNPGKRGRKRTPDSITKRLAAIDAAIPTANALARLGLTQERADLSAELAAMDGTNERDLTELEAAFTAVAASYSASKGIAYDTWRAVGVPPAVLKAAGVPR